MAISSEIQQTLNTRLAQRGFDFAAPDPGLAWIVFQEFVQVP
jgi:hypothetical protein